MTKSPINRAFALIASVLAFSGLVQCQGQGTMTLTFEGQPRGRQIQTGPYYEASMVFRASPIGALYLSGGGISGYPDNGTGYLELPDNGTTDNRITFGPNASDPAWAPFNLLSFDAARFGSLPGPHLTVIGYGLSVAPVTNYFTVVSGGSDFQTFHLDSSFVNLDRVDMYGDSWGRFSLDNVVVGIPEPSTGGLVCMGTACTLGWSRFRRAIMQQQRQR